jgi:hypothetical protein
MAPGSLFVLFSLPLEARVSTLPLSSRDFSPSSLASLPAPATLLCALRILTGFRKLSTSSRAFLHKRKDGQSPNMLSGEVREASRGPGTETRTGICAVLFERTDRTEILNLEYITLPRRNAASLNQDLAAMTRLGHGEDRFRIKPGNSSRSAAG